MPPFVVAGLVAVVSIVVWAIGWTLGRGTGLALAVVVSAPILGFGLAPLVSLLLSDSVRAVRTIAYRDIEGRHFEFKGKRIRVHEDLAGDRWLRASDIRKVAAGFPRDAVLLRIAPDDVGTVAGRRELFMRAQALDRYLQRSQDDTSVRFRHWLQRDVLFPAQRAVATLQR